MVLILLAWLAPSEASSVSGCRYTGEVRGLADNDARTTIELRVVTVEAFGHSGAPAICTAVSETARIAMANGPALDALHLQPGMIVEAEVTDVYNPPRHHHHDERVVRVLAPACRLEDQRACLDVAACTPMAPARLHDPMGSVTIEVMGPTAKGCGLCIQGEVENPRWTWTGCGTTPSCVVPTTLGRVTLPYTDQAGHDTSPLLSACLP